ncbi:hypothetical protein C8T65DRAFT_804649 [Cerioporus squamosus]|nr:hypothetical protein C8T65DRAFT_804649 [Cerioporus squamosus]
MSKNSNSKCLNGDETDTSPTHDKAHRAIRDALDLLSPEQMSSFGLPAFHRIYTTAPLPVLNIHRVGVVGLPLNDRQVHVLQQQRRCGTSPSTSDEADTKCLRYDAQEFSIDNPAWQDFMNEVAREACEVLAIDYEANAPVCKLLSLSLECADSSPQLVHFKPRHESTRAERPNRIPQSRPSYDGLNTLADVLLVLPSKCTHGAMQVCYGEQCFSYGVHALTAADVLVLAWRREANLRMEPVNSGSRTILSVALVSTASDPALPLPMQPDTLLQMDNMFSTWQQARRREAPSKLVRLLGSKYNQANVRRSALRGSDAHFVSILAEFARMYSFKTGLAVLGCRLRGERMYHDASDDEEDDLEEALDEAEEDSDSDSRSMGSDEGAEEDVQLHRYKKELRKRYPPPSEKLVNLVDLDGTVLQNEVHCGDHTQLYPDNLLRTLSSHSYQLFDDLPPWERSFVLVMWPSWADFDLVHGQRAFSAACHQLRPSTGDHPTAEQQELVDLILAHASPSSRPQVIDSVCRAACAWHDKSLWDRALDACSADADVESLGFENICLAVKAFGFANIQRRLETAIGRDPSDLAVLQFLRDLEFWMSKQTMIDGDRPESLYEDQAAWVTSQRKKRLQALRSRLTHVLSDLEHIEPAEIKSIVAGAAIGGEPSLVFEHIVPGVTNHNISLRLDSLSTLVDEMLDRQALLDPDGRNMSYAVNRLLHKYMISIDLNELRAAHVHARVADALEYCFNRGVPDASLPLLKRVTQPGGADLDKDYIKDVAVPVLEHLVHLMHKHQLSLTLPAFAPFVRTILSLWAATVIGSLPQDTAATLQQLQLQLNGWSCTCEHCSTVKTWMTEEPERSMTYDRIGGTKRKHLEKFMKAHAMGLATWDPIMTTPQGIEITKTDTVAAPVEWFSHVQQGLKLLHDVGLDARELCTILGEEAGRMVRYFLGHISAGAVEQSRDIGGVEDALAMLLLATPQTIVAQIPHEPPNSQPLPRPSTPTAGPSVARSEYDGLPENLEHHAMPRRTRRSQTSGPSGAAEPSRKRRKTSCVPEDVIDLT